MSFNCQSFTKQELRKKSLELPSSPVELLMTIQTLCLANNSSIKQCIMHATFHLPI